MKFRSLLALLSTFCTSLPAVEYGVLELGQTQTIAIDTGDIFEAVGHDRLNSSIAFAFTTPSGLSRYYYNSYDQIIVGPSTISLLERMPSDSSSYYPSVYLYYKLTRASEIEYKQANIVSLPIDTVGAGTHEIVVEASDDLQTWTAVHSSSIGGNKAFFRTRVVATGPLP